MLYYQNKINKIIPIGISKYDILLFKQFNIIFILMFKQPSLIPTFEYLSCLLFRKFHILFYSIIMIINQHLEDIFRHYAFYIPYRIICATHPNAIYTHNVFLFFLDCTHGTRPPLHPPHITLTLYDFLTRLKFIFFIYTHHICQMQDITYTDKHITMCQM